jgi:hypothetical protein
MAGALPAVPELDAEIWIGLPRPAVQVVPAAKGCRGDQTPEAHLW